MEGTAGKMMDQAADRAAGQTGAHPTGHAAGHATGHAMGLADVPSRYDGVKLEEEVLALWREHDMFNEAQRASEGRPLYCWNEGPPTANGRPGIHHVLARTFKDIFPRFKHMQGYHCPRKAGWDTHGLPVEHEIEKELGIFDKAEIERQVGVAEFTRRCRESVMRYIGDWERMTERMGFWVNMGDAYYTLDNSYIESVWWLLRQIWDKGLIYQGYKVVPYDPRIGATLSSHEVALGYREVEDPSIYVRFPVEGAERTSFLVWTTTPWTLPSNLALAVHPEVDYVFVRIGSGPGSGPSLGTGPGSAAGSTAGETLILAEALVDTVLRDAEYTIEKRVKGAELEGMRYTRLFDYLPADGPIGRVWTADFVTIEDGTGIVHCAPAYGEDDIRLGQAKGLPVVHGVGLDGCFLPEVEPVAGKFFKDADPILITELERRGLMFRAERYLHNYPHGWRTGDPLIYYAKHAWYIGTSRIRDRMVELNRTIRWVPETIRDGRFGNWLANNVDWALSRERFWGTPLPVWTDGEGDFMCIGSVAELEGLCGRSLKEVDLHRPTIDEITFTHPDNERTYRRVPEVIDCWFDSGAMSYAQFHYPFENRDLFERRFPADYICEAIDQTRGWFYSLHAIAALVSDSVAYRNCICLAHIVDKDGKKMSKSQGNIVNPYDVFDHVGADPLRWYLACRIAPEAQKRISVDFVRGVASGFINTWWNTYAFFVMYAKLDRIDLAEDVPLAERPEIDRWALARLHRTVAGVTDALEAYDVLTAGRAIESFVDQLSNWYVRRNRRRFWKAAAGPDKQAAYLTLYECLHTVNRLMAPIMPFITETVHRNLVCGVDDTAPASVHMSEWPVPDPAARDDALMAEIEVVQRVVGLGRAARNGSGVRVRQPLARLLVRVPDDTSAASVMRHAPQILEELNVKAVEMLAPDADLLSYRIKPNLPRIGRRFGKRVPAVRAALAAADGGAIATAVAAGRSFDIDVAGEVITFEPEDVLVESTSAEGYSCAEEGGYLVGLDTSLTEALEREGLARELVRTVQEARKQAGLDVSDRITLRIDGTPDVAAALAAHRDYVMDETLATVWVEPDWLTQYNVESSLGAIRWVIRFSRAERA
ncbi:MAG: isoleucine--tRNA ligase [Thiotrichales bacterium]|nr:isoleucine--tRNA ligase [Thiotrichales bacterium]